MAVQARKTEGVRARAQRAHAAEAQAHDRARVGTRLPASGDNRTAARPHRIGCMAASTQVVGARPLGGRRANGGDRTSPECRSMTLQGPTAIGERWATLACTYMIYNAGSEEHREEEKNINRLILVLQVAVVGNYLSTPCLRSYSRYLESPSPVRHQTGPMRSRPTELRLFSPIFFDYSWKLPYGLDKHS
jgi:hypothetical protein